MLNQFINNDIETIYYIDIKELRMITNYNTNFVFIFGLLTLDCLLCIASFIDNKSTIVLSNSYFTIQYILILLGLYNIICLCMIYQRQLKKNNIIKHFILFDICKLILIIIGYVIIFNYNNYIILYSILYIIYITYSFVQTHKLTLVDQYTYLY